MAIKCLNKNKELPKIIVPTFFDGSNEPKHPTEGSVWYNNYNGTVKVFLGTKWFDMIDYKETGYTEIQQEEIQKNLENKNEKVEDELETYKNKLKQLKNILSDLFNIE